MINAPSAGRHQASEPLHLSLVFDASVRLQTGGALRHAVSKHRNGVVNSRVRATRCRFTHRPRS
jgi:hypothetical protein